MRRAIATLALTAGLAAQNSGTYGEPCGARMIQQGTAYCGQRTGYVVHVVSEGSRPGLYMRGLRSSPIILPPALSRLRCRLRIYPLSFLPIVTSKTGQMGIPFASMDCRLIGVRVEEQFAILTASDGIATTEGGFFVIQAPKG